MTDYVSYSALDGYVWAVTLFSFVLHCDIFHHPTFIHRLGLQMKDSHYKSVQDQTHHARSLIAAIFHATVVVLCVLTWLWCYGFAANDIDRLVRGGIQGTGDDYIKYVNAFSLGYFLYDLLVLFLFPSISRPSTVLHHLAVATSLFSGLVTGIGAPLHFFFMLEEISTPFLHIKTLYEEHPVIAKYCRLLFALWFVAGRFGWGMYLSYQVAQIAPTYVRLMWEQGEMCNAAITVYGMSMCVIMRCLNSYWLYLIGQRVWSTQVKHD